MTLAECTCSFVHGKAICRIAMSSSPLFSLTDELGIRLVNSSGDLSRGSLEVYYQGEWRGVCADGFTPDDCSAACRQLGFDGGDWDLTNISSGREKP